MMVLHFTVPFGLCLPTGHKLAQIAMLDKGLNFIFKSNIVFSVESMVLVKMTVLSPILLF